MRPEFVTRHSVERKRSQDRRKIPFFPRLFSSSPRATGKAGASDYTPRDAQSGLPETNTAVCNNRTTTAIHQAAMGSIRRSRWRTRKPGSIIAVPASRDVYNTIVKYLWDLSHSNILGTCRNRECPPRRRGMPAFNWPLPQVSGSSTTWS